MSLRTSVAQVIAGSTTIAGPVLASAEASGALDAVGHKLAMYVASGALTLIGLLVSGLFYFVKREYSNITGGLDRLEAAMVSVQTLLVELRGEVARRVSVEDHSRSAGALHEKINRLDRTVAYVRAKLGMRENDDGSERG